MSQLELAESICAELNAESFERIGEALVGFSGNEDTLGIVLGGEVALYDDQGDSHSEESPNELSVDACRKAIVLYAKKLLRAFAPGEFIDNRTPDMVAHQAAMDGGDD